MEDKIKQKYKKQLEYFSKENEEFKDQLIALLTELINATETFWDYNMIRYDTVMNKKEWKEFSEHPERKPYKSKVFSKNIDDLYDETIQALKDIYPYYKSLKKSTYKTKLANSMATTLKCAMNGKYDTESMRLADEYVGRTDEQRDNGKVDPTPMGLSKLNYAIREYAKYSNKDYKKLKKKIYDLTEGGRIGLISEYLMSCALEDDLREEFYGITDVLRRDLTLSFASIRMGWNIWKDVRDIGMNLDDFLEIRDLPKHSVIKRKLLEFQKNPKHVKEMEKHMEDELPNSYKLYKKEGKVNARKLFAEEAKRKKWPKRLRKTAEVEKMVEECQKEVNAYFPLAQEKTPRNVLFNPTHPASTSRAFQSGTKNHKKQDVNVIVMTPRVDHKDSYLPTLAHEVTHLLHKIVLDKGERAKVLEKGASEQIPSSVLEDFSQLVDKQFKKESSLPYKKKYEGDEFPTFRSGYTSRFQVPFSLVQLGIREEFDKMYDSGFRDELTEQQIWDLKNKFDPMLHEWFSASLNVTVPYLKAFNLFAAYNPDDGVVYMKRYMTEKSSDSKSSVAESKRTKKDEEGMEMAQAFRKKYGRDWEDNKDARTMLLWLLLESGRNYKTETFWKHIMNKDIEDCKTELKKINITSDLI